jgi:ribosome-interacting GTPase 1
LNVYNIRQGNVVIRDDISDDELIDVAAGNCRYIPAIVVLNKIDLVNAEYMGQVKNQIDEAFVAISAERNLNMERLKEAIYDRLNFIRVYLKPRNGKADLEEPLVLPAGSTISDVCAKIHRRFASEPRYALVSGRSVRFNSQRVGMNHILDDRDIVTIVVGPRYGKQRNRF